MKITNKTLLILKRRGDITKANYNYRISLIADILKSAGSICGNPEEGYEVFDVDSDGTGLVRGDYPVKCARGIQSRYPSYIETTLTHGNNQVRIVDANKLVASILSE